MLRLVRTALCLDPRRTRGDGNYGHRVRRRQPTAGSAVSNGGPDRPYSRTVIGREFSSTRDVRRYRMPLRPMTAGRGEPRRRDIRRDAGD